MRQIADVDGIEQPEGSFLHLRTHTPDPFPPFGEFLQTSLPRSKAAVPARSKWSGLGWADQRSFPSMFTKYDAVVDITVRVHQHR